MPSRESWSFILCGWLLCKCISTDSARGSQILTEMVAGHQKRRKEVTDEVVQRFTAVRSMHCC